MKKKLVFLLIGLVIAVSLSVWYGVRVSQEREEF